MTTNKLTLKAGNNILKLMGKDKQAKMKAKQERLQMYKDPTFSLPKPPPNTNSPSNIFTYCQILEDELSTVSLTDNSFYTNYKEKNKSNNNFKVRHSSLSFIHNNCVSNDPKLSINNKLSKQIKSLQNKYSFSEIAQTSDINYFITKKFEPEIALFMSGANKVICVISQQKFDPGTEEFRARINLNHISSYILRTNKSLEIEKQRTYEVKFVGDDNPSFELSEDIDFLNSSVSVITPNMPPFSYLFVLNLVENEEITNFAKIIYQIRLSSKEGALEDKKQNDSLSSIITNYPPFRQICQICKKNSSFSVILFLFSSLINEEEKTAEKLVNLFCEKKKSFLINEYQESIEFVEPLIENKADDLDEKDENEVLTNESNNDDIGDMNNADSYFADDSGDNIDDDTGQVEKAPSEPIIDKKVNNYNEDESILMINRAESDIKEVKEYVNKNTPIQEKEDENDENKASTFEPIKETDNNSSLFELLKKLNNSEKENKEKLDKIKEIQDQLKNMEENLVTIKSRQLQIKNESDNVNQEITEILKQTEKQASENEMMKKNVKEMIIRTGQLKSKYNDLLSEIHEKERSQRESQWKIISEKEKEMKLKVSQSEEKWRKELENLKGSSCFIRNKENENENILIDQKSNLDSTNKLMQQNQD